MTNGGQQGRGWAPDPHLTPPAVYTPVEFPVRRLGTGLAAGKSDFSFKHHVIVAPTDARNRRSETFRTFTEMLL